MSINKQIDPNDELYEEDDAEEVPQLSPFQMYMNEHGKVVRAVVLTFIITSLVWATVVLVVAPGLLSSKGKGDKAAVVASQVSTEQQSKAEAPRYVATAKQNVDYSQDIVGHWEPVEVSAYKLDFSRYGTLKTKTNRHGYIERSEYKFKLLGDQMGYTIMSDFYEGDWHRIEIEKQDGIMYLTIFDDPELGGRYQKTE